jgi:talin
LECDQALAKLEHCLKMVESSLISLAMNHELTSDSSTKSLSAYNEHAHSCAAQIASLVDQVRVAAKGEADKLGHLITEISLYFEPLVINVIGCAARTEFNIQKQTLVLEQCKTVLESMLQLLIASKENAGNPKNDPNSGANGGASLHQAIDENADGTKEVLDDLMQTLEEAAVASQADSLDKSMRTMNLNARNQEEINRQQQDAATTSTVNNEENSQETSENSNNSYLSDEQKHILFGEYQNKIVEITRTLQQILQSMRECTDPAELGQQAAQLTQTYNCLILACKGCIQNSPSDDNGDSFHQALSQRIKAVAQDLGKSCIDLIHLTGQYQNENNGNEVDNSELLNQCRLVDSHAQELLNSFNHPSGASGENSNAGAQACANAESAITGILADLSTVCMFATSGTLKSDADSEDDSFGNHREAVLRSAKTLVEDTKALVSASGAQQIDQSELARCVQTSVRTIGRLADSVKLGAASLGSDQPEAQILVLNAVRDVAASLRDLVATIKQLSISVHNGNEYSASMLSDAAKSMITSVQSLLKTIKTVEDEAQRGTRALESAIDAVYQQVKQYSVFVNGGEDTSAAKSNSATGVVVPEDLIKATRQITLATSKAIGAGNSLRQEDVIVAANMGRKAVSDLLYVCHNVSINSGGNSGEKNAESGESLQRRQVLTAGLNCAVFYKELLDSILSVSLFAQLYLTIN